MEQAIETIIDARVCEQCGNPLVRRKQERTRDWRVRRFCRAECRNQWIRVHWIGTGHPNYRGGCVSRKYRIVYDHGKQIREHRFVMESHLGRKLLPGEVVHHNNEDGLDNRIENLELCASEAEHRKAHVALRQRQGYRRFRGVKECVQCGAPFSKNRKLSRKLWGKTRFCSHPCSVSYGMAERRMPWYKAMRSFPRDVEALGL